MSTRKVLLSIQKFAHMLSAYDIATGKEIKHIALEQYPHEFVVDPQGRFAYVGHYGIETVHHSGRGGCSVFVIDIERLEHVRMLNCWPFYRLHGLAMDRQGRLYVLSEYNSVLMVFDDPRSSDVPDRVMPSGGFKSHLVAVSPDGSMAFSINLWSHTVTYLQPHNPTAQPMPIYAGERPEGNCFGPEDRVLYVSSRGGNTICAVDTRTLQVTRTAPTGIDPTRIYRDRRDRLLVTNYGETSIWLFDLGLRKIGAIEFDANPVGLSFDPAAALAYVSLKNQQLAVVNLDTLRVERSFKVREEPDASAVVQVPLGA